jgi:hypothetical protein
MVDFGHEYPQTPEEFLEAVGVKRAEEPDTELHWMSGPEIPTPDYVLQSWKKAAADRRHDMGR